MPTPIEERNTLICGRYLNEGETAESIALDFGLSVVAIRVILRDGKSLRGTRCRVLRTDEERVISPLHARIGGMLSHHRAFTRGIDRKMAAEELKWSMQRVSSVEKGAFNITLLDLQDIARFVQLQLEDLLNGPTRTKQPSLLEHAPSPGANPNVVPFPTPTQNPDSEEWPEDHHRKKVV